MEQDPALEPARKRQGQEEGERARGGRRTQRQIIVDSDVL